VPWDDEDAFHNVFQTGLQAGLGADRWHDLNFAWDCDKRQCRLTIDGGAPRVLPQQRTAQVQGICYLRLRSTALGTDAAGMLVGHAAVEVAPRRK
jgi:hypothetical protein